VVAATIDPASLRNGRVRGRCETQAEIDLAQIVPELVTTPMLRSPPPVRQMLVHL